MGPYSTDSIEFNQTFSEWLSNQKELFVEYYRPHSGGDGIWYLVREPAQLEALVKEAQANSVIFVLRQPQLQIRGLVDDDFISRAIASFREGEWWILAEPSFYPCPIDYEADDTIEALRKALKQRIGMVCLGPEPDFFDSYWEQNDDPDVIIGRKPEQQLA